jgi:hypothetical protein
MPRFEELIAAHPAAAECLIEFESKSGSKMRIQWKGSGAPDWSSLLPARRETAICRSPPVYLRLKAAGATAGLRDRRRRPRPEVLRSIKG